MPFLIVLAYFLIEFLAFWALGQWLGFGWALVVLALVFCAGLALAGVQIRALARRGAQQPEQPGKTAGGLALTAAGAVLVAVPGVVTSVLGLLLILPPTREAVRRLMARQIRRRVEDFGTRVMSAASGSRESASYGSFGGGPFGGAAHVPQSGPSSPGPGSGHEVIDEEEIAKFQRQLDDFEGLAPRDGDAQGGEDEGDAGR